MLRRATMLALAVALAACGGDDDGGPAVCEAPDPEGLCPGEFAFEAFVSDLETGTAVLDALVADSAEPTTSTRSAPNGRAGLCMLGGDRRVTTQHPDHVTRIDAVTSCAVARAVGAGQAYPIEMVSAAFLAGHGVEESADVTHVLVSVRRYPDGGALAGASVELDAAHDEVIMLGDTFLFPNVPAAGVEAALSLSADADCTGPDIIPFVPGAMVGAVFACQ